MRTQPLFTQSAFAVCLISILTTGARASCGASNCPIDVYSAEKTDKGYVRLDYAYEYIDQDEPRISRRRASAREIRGHHDEVSTLNEIQRLGIEVGLSSRFSLQVSLPFIHREHQHIHRHQGADLNETWNFDGMGDLTVLTRTALNKPSSEKTPTVSFIAGGVLPTGKEEVINDDGDEAEAGILPGKGAYSLILGAASVQTFSAPTLSGIYAEMPFFLSSTYQWNADGPDNYRLGNVWLANAGLTYPLFPKLGFINQINLKVSRRDDRGNTSEEVQKTGGTFVYYSPGFQFTMSEGLWSYFMVQIPVYQRVNVIQLTSDYNFITGLSYRFSVL
jgi:hypothetical protein